MKRYLLLLLLLLSTTGYAARFTFKRISMENGLSSPQVTSILQTGDGIIWIGTTEGLNRYDGHSLHPFLPSAGNTDSIQGNAIRELAEDGSGALWVCFASGGISRYDPQTRTFRNFSREWMQQQLRVYGNVNCFSNALEECLLIGTDNGLLAYNYHSGKLERFAQAGSTVSSSPVYCLYTAPDNTLWVGALSGFSRYDRVSACFIDHQIRTGQPEDEGSGNLNGVHAIYTDHFGYLWIGTGKKGAFRSVDPGDASVFRPAGKRGLPVHCFLETRQGDFWIGHNQGVSRISRENRVSLRTEHFLDSPEALAPTGEKPIYKLQEDITGTVWIGSGHLNRELHYYLPETKQMRQLKNRPEDAFSICNSQVSCFYIDNNNRLWAGHPGYGASYCNLVPPLFGYTTAHADDEGQNRLSSDEIRAVCEDSDGNLWIGTAKGLDRLNGSSCQVDRHFTFSPTRTPAALSGKIISSINEDAHRCLWVCYLDAAPDCFSLDHLRKFPYMIHHRSFYKTTLKQLTSVVAGQDGAIWFATGDASLIKYDPSIGKAYFYTQPALPGSKSNTSYPETHPLCMDTEGGIWMGTDGYGLRFLEPDTETFTDYRHTPGEDNSLASDHIHCLCCDAAGTLWIGTDAGVDRLDRHTGEFTHFSTQQGLAGNSIQGIQEGLPGQLFISTHKGISRMDTRSGKVTNYSTENGLLSNEFTADVCCRRKSGDLAFGSHAGLLSFNPARIAAEEKAQDNQSLRNLRKATDTTSEKDTTSKGKTRWIIVTLFIASLISFLTLYKIHLRRQRGKNADGIVEKQQGTSVPEIEKDFIAKATKVVLDNLQNPEFDVDAFCSQMAMSRASLFRKLKSSTGSSASAFTRTIRIREAALLLEQKRYTIGEIASMVGFADPNYFSRCFKEIYKVTPSEFTGQPADQGKSIPNPTNIER